MVMEGRDLFVVAVLDIVVVFVVRAGRLSYMILLLRGISNGV